jgi:hypothetical protein
MKRFEDLDPGDYFELLGSRIYYMKTEDHPGGINCVIIGTGELDYVWPKAEVKT